MRNKIDDTYYTARTNHIMLAVSTVITPLALALSMIFYMVNGEKHEKHINEVAAQVAELREELNHHEEPPEDRYEKKLKELGEKIAEIDKKWEEMFDESKTIIIENEVQEGESKERLPTGVDTNRFDCEPHTFRRGSDQYLLQLDCLTEEETGLRYFEKDGMRYYCVALGGAYGIDIGDTWIVTLECGTSFGIIFSDYQHDITQLDPNDFGECYERDIYGNVVGILKNYDEEPVVHVLEFVVEMEKLHPDILDAGTVSVLDRFGGLFGNGGNIVSIKYTGRMWEYAA